MTSVAKWNGSAGDSAASGTTCLETNYPAGAPAFTLPAGCPANFNGSGSHFDDYWLTIEVPIPDNYGSGGLLPPGETQPGWWKIEYTVAGGNDTTTWKVDIVGNPVHLIVP